MLLPRDTAYKFIDNTTRLLTKTGDNEQYVQELVRCVEAPMPPKYEKKNIQDPVVPKSFLSHKHQ